MCNYRVNEIGCIGSIDMVVMEEGVIRDGIVRFSLICFGRKGAAAMTKGHGVWRS